MAGEIFIFFLCDIKYVINTKNSQIIDASFPVIDIGFSMIQSIFGANKNLLPFLSNQRLQECEENGIVEVSNGIITYIGN